MRVERVQFAVDWCIALFSKFPIMLLGPGDGTELIVPGGCDLDIPNGHDIRTASLP